MPVLTPAASASVGGEVARQNGHVEARVEATQADGATNAAKAPNPGPATSHVKQRKTLTTEQKVALLRECEEHERRNEKFTLRQQGDWLKQKYNLDYHPSKTTVSHIHGIKSKLMECAQSTLHLQQRKLRNGEYPRVEERVRDWHRFQMATTGACTDSELRHQAKEIAKDLGIDLETSLCKFSDSWLRKFKLRAGITEPLPPAVQAPAEQAPAEQAPAEQAPSSGQPAGRGENEDVNVQVFAALRLMKEDMMHELRKTKLEILTEVRAMVDRCMGNQARQGQSAGIAKRRGPPVDRGRPRARVRRSPGGSSRTEAAGEMEVEADDA